eukprot:SAG22_NODE_18420_length_287_cov_1.382979_1_plen_70_part_01
MGDILQRYFPDLGAKLGKKNVKRTTSKFHVQFTDFFARVPFDDTAISNFVSGDDSKFYTQCEVDEFVKAA